MKIYKLQYCESNIEIIAKLFQELIGNSVYIKYIEINNINRNQIILSNSHIFNINNSNLNLMIDILFKNISFIGSISLKIEDKFIIWKQENGIFIACNSNYSFHLSEIISKSDDLSHLLIETDIFDHLFI